MPDQNSKHLKHGIAVSSSVPALIQKHAMLSQSIETLNSCPDSSICEERFLQEFSRLEVLMNEVFATEEEVLSKVGAPDSEVRKHIEEHDKLLSILVSIYEFSMKHKKMSAADVYILLRKEFSQHAARYDAIFASI